MLLPLLAAAFAGPLVPVQGELTSMTAPLSGAAPVTFRLWDVATGGEPVHLEPRTVDFANGHFAALIGVGPTFTDTFFRDHPSLWLSVEVGGAESERVGLGVAPYAAYAAWAGRAVDADQLGGEVAANYRLDNEEIPWTQIDDAVGAALPHTLTSLGAGCATGQVPVRTIAGWTCQTADATLGTTGVTAGAYPLATVTVNPQGRVTAIQAGTAYTDAAAVAAVAATNAYLPKSGGGTVTGAMTVTGTATVGGLSTTGKISGETVSFRNCGGSYTCTPRQCAALCQANNERMATVDEMLAYAASGRDYCGYVWMLDAAAPTEVRSGYPMWGLGSGGCGGTVAFAHPRIVALSSEPWSSTGLRDCACSTLK